MQASFFDTHTRTLTFSHEDSIVVTLPKYERGKDDIDNIKLHSTQ